MDTPFRTIAHQVAPLALAGCLAGPAAAQQVIASLPFPPGQQTAGSPASDYEPPEDHLDTWMIEDFSIARPATLARFESRGWVHPQPLFVFGVTARIYRGWPASGGELIAESIPGSGTVVPFAGWGLYSAQFAGQRLDAGDYYIAMTAATRTSVGSHALFWVAFGPHQVGGGGTDNAYRWNPNGGWGWPNNVMPVPSNFMGTGHSGINFILYGNPEPACDPDLTAGAVAGTPGYGAPNGVLNNDDFFYYLAQFAAGNLAVADLTTSAIPGSPGYGTPNGMLDNDDFFYYLAIFAAGC